ncbi:MAG: recombinase family protein, partial [Ferruginibacter sp.]
MKCTAIALCRVSTAKQRTEGNSLEAQEKRVYDAADFIQAPIEKFWSLNVSSRKGKNFNRKDLHQMLAYAKQYRRIQFVIVDEVDRFMRSVDEFYYWKVRFREEAGARLVYAAKPE